MPSLANLSVTTHGQYGSVVFNSIYPRFERPGLAVSESFCMLSEICETRSHNFLHTVRFVKLGLTVFCKLSEICETRYCICLKKIFCMLSEICETTAHHFLQAVRDL